MIYTSEKNIKNGPIFLTSNGRPLNRSNIWAEMKCLCEKAGVQSSKVFPHNLRHLFGKTYYTTYQDIVSLADILGHTSINTTRIQRKAERYTEAVFRSLVLYGIFMLRRQYNY